MPVLGQISKTRLVTYMAVTEKLYLSQKKVKRNTPKILISLIIILLNKGNKSDLFYLNFSKARHVISIKNYQFM